jgi:hypothetical protein
MEKIRPLAIAKFAEHCVEPERLTRDRSFGLLHFDELSCRRASAR